MEIIAALTVAVAEIGAKRAEKDREKAENALKVCHEVYTWIMQLN